MRHFPIRELGYAIGFVVLLAALYVGSYFLAVTPTTFASPDGGGVSIRMKPAYPAEWMEPVFAPIYEIDRKLRPEAWKVPFW
jgi:hypothetical protein